MALVCMGVGWGAARRLHSQSCIYNDGDFKMAWFSKQLRRHIYDVERVSLSRSRSCAGFERCKRPLHPPEWPSQLHEPGLPH